MENPITSDYVPYIFDIKNNLGNSVNSQDEYNNLISF